MKNTDVFEKARKFIYRNARPIEFARWKYHFENGSPEEVVKILAMYQNEDGGFGHALEADNWNVNSTPITTWTAITYLREIGFPNCADAIIQGILNYLDSGKDFAEGKWFNVVVGNNDYPHAIWWECKEPAGVPDDNPTVSLAGFLLKFADKDSNLYKKAEEIASLAVNGFMENGLEEFHTLRCYCELLHYCEDIEDLTIFDRNAFQTGLYETINRIVCREPEKWFTEYVCRPSMFWEKGCSYIDQDLAEKEADMMIDRQLSDGSFPVTWQWWTEYKEYEISENWWKSCQIIENMLYLRGFSKI
ncbi:MAG: hypothetical protein J6K48_14575 [Lachnospiraceae bacterium]|nr:hypothetical protein [Lachnospiraceae bacterium]